MATLESYLGWKVDFRTPPGEPAFCAPDSMAWRIYKNPVALGVGGVCAVLLEFADARIRSGVWDHSVFAQDPVGRSERTGMAALVGVYGPQSAARKVIGAVNRMHERVAGTTPSGEAYRALDPELLAWVAATAGYGFLTAYDRFVEPLDAEDKQRFFSEGKEVAALYGVETPIASLADFDAMLMRLEPRFEPHPINVEFLDIMRSGRAAKGVPRSLQRALAHAAVSILPPRVRERLELGPEYDLSRGAEWWVRAVGRLAERIPARRGPAAQACERLGLPPTFLWKRREVQQRDEIRRAGTGIAEHGRHPAGRLVHAFRHVRAGRLVTHRHEADAAAFERSQQRVDLGTGQPEHEPHALGRQAPRQQLTTADLAHVDTSRREPTACAGARLRTTS